jgi:hypothetical protein
MPRELVSANHITIEAQAIIDALPEVRAISAKMKAGERTSWPGKPLVMHGPDLLRQPDADGCNWEFSRHQGRLDGPFEEWWPRIMKALEPLRAKYNIRQTWDGPSPPMIKRRGM